MAQASPSAVAPTMRDVFKAMPDSLMPYLTENNRLDMIDFMEAHMRAEVTNLLDGKSEMTALTDDSLSIRMSAALQVNMKLVRQDSCLTVRVERIYQTHDEHQSEQTVQCFDSDWCPLTSELPVSSTLLRRDEELAGKPHF